MTTPPHEHLYVDDHLVISLHARREKIDGSGLLVESNLRTTGEFELQAYQKGELGDGQFIDSDRERIVSEGGEYLILLFAVRLRSPELAEIESKIKRLREDYS